MILAFLSTPEIINKFLDNNNNYSEVIDIKNITKTKMEDFS